MSTHSSILGFLHLKHTNTVILALRVLCTNGVRYDKASIFFFSSYCMFKFIFTVCFFFLFFFHFVVMAMFLCRMTFKFFPNLYVKWHYMQVYYVRL
jgi:hypothetical protein